MRMKRWSAVTLAGCLLAASLVSSPPASAAQPSPQATVETFHEILLNVADGATESSAQQRYDRLAPAIERAFDTALMARIAGGTAWQKADAEARARLEAALLRFSAAYYASQFEGSDMRFAVDGVGDGPGKTKLVNTKLIVPNREAVKMVYVMREDAESGNWRIVDVLLDGGISQLAQRRSEYHRIATSEGAPGLAKALNEKADQLLSRH